MLRRHDFDMGNTVVQRKTLRELRGLFTHYSNCNHKWKIFARPIDALLAYDGDCSMWIQCEDSEYRIGFWNMIVFLRDISTDESAWELLFKGTLLDLLPARVRFTGPTMRENILWFSGDAALTRVSCINWNAKQFLRLPVSELLGPFLPKHQQGLIIADVELLSMILSVVTWGSAGKNEVLLVASDNTNAISWMAKKRAKKGIAQRLMGAFLRWIVSRDLDYGGVYA